jgi:hypothetical protein
MWITKMYLKEARERTWLRNDNEMWKATEFGLWKTSYLETLPENVQNCIRKSIWIPCSPLNTGHNDLVRFGWIKDLAINNK